MHPFTYDSIDLLLNFLQSELRCVLQILVQEGIDDVVDECTELVICANFKQQVVLYNIGQFRDVPKMVLGQFLLQRGHLPFVVLQDRVFHRHFLTVVETFKLMVEIPVVLTIPWQSPYRFVEQAMLEL